MDNNKVQRLPAWMVSLLNSRKFWLAAMGVTAGIVLFVRGEIAADQLVDLILVLVGVVIASIAIEDGAEKLGGGRLIEVAFDDDEEDDDERQFQG